MFGIEKRTEKSLQITPEEVIVMVKQAVKEELKEMTAPLKEAATHSSNINDTKSIQRMIQRVYRKIDKIYDAILQPHSIKPNDNVECNISLKGKRGGKRRNNLSLIKS